MMQPVSRSYPLGPSSSRSLLPLHAPAECGNLGLVQQLLADGAQLEQADQRGWTALHAAAVAGQHEVVQQLLAAGADVEAAAAAGYTPLHAAAAHWLHKVVQVLLSAGADAEPTDWDGNTPMHLAACAGKPLAAQHLLAAGANTAAANMHGTTPLHMAVDERHHDLVRLLMRNGANPQARSRQGTPLGIAAASGNLSMVRLVLDSRGQPAVTPNALIQAAQVASTCAWAELAKELHKLSPIGPAEAQQLFEGEPGWHPLSAQDAMVVLLHACSSDISSIEEQRAALRKQEEEVEAEKEAVQGLLVQVACMAATDTEQDMSQGDN